MFDHQFRAWNELKNGISPPQLGGSSGVSTCCGLGRAPPPPRPRPRQKLQVGLSAPGRTCTIILKYRSTLLSWINLRFLARSHALANLRSDGAEGQARRLLFRYKAAPHSWLRD